ncbi:MAG: hypothetical protein KGN76_14580 [Acidobacteriota bacterium]|nr:hypothetical protein [Acidobacteriota bacterium]
MLARPQAPAGRPDERGAALLVAILAALLLAVLGAGMLLTTATDVQLAANHRDGLELFHLADAAADLALGELGARSDWNLVLDGAATSTFADGPPTGARDIAPGTRIVLDDLVNEANCGRPAGCSAAAVDAVTADRPWGPDNPRWHLFAWGPATGLAAFRRADRPGYVVVLVADDQGETDGDPARDGLPGPDNPGAGVLVLRAQAFGAGGLRQMVEVTVSRTGAAVPTATPGDDGTVSQVAGTDGSETAAAGAAGPSFIRLLSWRWIR